MTGYHVTTRKKFLRYLETGRIWPPVRFWITIADAERFSRQTGRRVILRISVPDDAAQSYPGHRGRAWVCQQAIVLRDF